jgi:hypothetical protein
MLAMAENLNRTGKTMVRTYDIKEYSDKVKAALLKLEQTQKPGEQEGKGGKSEVILAAKDEVNKLLEKGYTAKQIADALRGDVFGILPKTITELFHLSNKPKVPRKQAQKKQTSLHQTTPVTYKKESKKVAEHGSIKVREDSNDL